MFARILTVSLSALLAAALASEAHADHRQRRRIIVQEQVYAPGFFERIPGVRTLFGDYALTEEEYDALYGPGTRDFDESYYDPEPAQPVKPRAKPLAKPAAKAAAKTVKEPSGQTSTARQAPSAAKPASGEKTASAAPDTEIATPSKSAATPEKTASAAGKITCEKATGIITGYGFSSVKPESCQGKVYAFAASRGGKSFAVKLDSGSGELTEVKKLP